MADIDELAGRLDHELPDVSWDEPDRIRRRGRERVRRRSVVMAAVAVLVIAAGAGWLATGPRSTPAGPPAPETTASPSSPPAGALDETGDGSRLFPVAALPQPADVGSGYRLTNQHGYSPGSYPAWTFERPDCPAYDSLQVSAFRSYLWFRHANLEKSGAPTVFVDGRRMPPGAAAAVLDDVDRVTAACARWDVVGGDATSAERPGTTTTSYAVLAKDFAGDQARLVRQRYETRDDDGVRLADGTVVIAVVRVGDRITTVMVEEDAPELVRLLGERAAQRLCAAGDGC
ncbi:hypothetical protein [Asanoa sp. NPDC050611]|uniref:hypothetical protein n=1 Tax=Asanoa sp. NPDC050611 TaxID=3157098 RepID=UPI0033D335D0